MTKQGASADCVSWMTKVDTCYTWSEKVKAAVVSKGVAELSAKVEVYAKELMKMAEKAAGDILDKAAVEAVEKFGAIFQEGFKAAKDFAPFTEATRSCVRFILREQNLAQSKYQTY